MAIDQSTNLDDIERLVIQKLTDEKNKIKETLDSIPKIKTPSEYDKKFMLQELKDIRHISYVDGPSVIFKFHPIDMVFSYDQNGQILNNITEMAYILSSLGFIKYTIKNLEIKINRKFSYASAATGISTSHGNLTVSALNTLEANSRFLFNSGNLFADISNGINNMESHSGNTISEFLLYIINTIKYVELTNPSLNIHDLNSFDYTILKKRVDLSYDETMFYKNEIIRLIDMLGLDGFKYNQYIDKFEMTFRVSTLISHSVSGIEATEPAPMNEFVLSIPEKAHFNISINSQL